MAVTPQRVEHQLTDKGYVPVYTTAVVEQPWASYSKADHATWAEHGTRFVAAVERGPLSGTQFHPEKSGDAGAHLLENWLKTL